MSSSYRRWQVHRHYQHRLPRLHQKALDRPSSGSSESENREDRGQPARQPVRQLFGLPATASGGLPAGEDSKQPIRSNQVVAFLPTSSRVRSQAG